MARLMEEYEKRVEPHLTGQRAKADSEQFKRAMRDEIKELTADGCDVIDALGQGQELNGAAIALRDQIGASRP